MKYKSNNLLGAPSNLATYEIVLSACLIASTLTSGTILASTTASAEEAHTSATASVNVTSACNFTGTVQDPHEATIKNGILESNIGTTLLKAYCNDNGGFSIHAIGYTDEEYGKTVLSSQTIGDSKDILTGTNTGDTSAWAMKLDNSLSTAYPITLDNGFDAYHIVPTTYTQVAHRDSGTDIGTEATGVTLSATYQVYISSDQPADTYLGKVKYTMVHPASDIPNQPKTTQEGKIGYYPNANGTVVDTMADQSAESNTEVTLWPSNFSRPGYGFAGWNDKFDMSGTNYGPMESITTPDLTEEGLSLYANWIKSKGKMQNWTGCDSLNIGDVTALTDSRDNNTYAIAKLADGKCWMIENLRLDDSAELTAANTNNPSLPLTNSWYFNNRQDTLTTSNHLSVNLDPSITPWCQDKRTPACDDQSMLYTGNTTDAVSNMTKTDLNVYSYGNYYNWYSATAGKGTYGIGQNNNSVDGDLCPSNWRLPTGGDKNNAASSDLWELGLLLTGAEPTNSSYYTGTLEGISASMVFRSYPNNFIYSGRVYYTVVERGRKGNFWASTIHFDTKSYNLGVNSDSVYPGAGDFDINGGMAVRCIIGS